MPENDEDACNKDKLLFDEQQRKDVFRNYANIAIENSHSVLKQVWVALFAGGASLLLSSAGKSFDCSWLGKTVDITNRNQPNCPSLFMEKYATYSGDMFLVFFLATIYMLVFYRFYVGNIRVFDMRYNEAGKFLKELIDVARVARATQSAAACSRDEKEMQKKIDTYYRNFYQYLDGIKARENIFLMFKVLAIAALGAMISTPSRFIFDYVVILFADLVWLNFSPSKDIQYFTNLFQGALSINKEDSNNAVNAEEKSQTEERKPKYEVDSSFEFMFPREAMNLWRLNNEFCFFLLAICAVALCAIVLVEVSPSFLPQQFIAVYAKYSTWTPITFRCLFWIAGLIMFYNCCEDLWITWNFYNPNFKPINNALCGISPKRKIRHGLLRTLGSRVRTHLGNQNMTIAAMVMVPMKMSAQRS